MFDAQGGVYGGSAQRPAEMVRALGLKTANGCHVLGVLKATNADYYVWWPFPCGSLVRDFWRRQR